MASTSSTPAVDAAPTTATTTRRLDVAMMAAGLAAFGLIYVTQALLPSISREFGVDATLASLTVTLSTGALGLAVLPLSSLAETVGRARVMAWALFVGSAFTALSGLAPEFWQVLVARAVVGVALAGIVAVAMGHIGDEVPAARVSTSIGLYVSGTTLGGLAGRLVPSVLHDLATWRVGVVAFAVAAALVSLVFVLLLPPARHFTPAPARISHHLAAFGEHLRDRRIRSLCLAAFLLIGGMVAVYNYLGYRLTSAPFDLPTSVVGLIFVAYLAGTVSSTVAGRLVRLIGRTKLLCCCIVVALCGLMVTLSSALALVVVGLVVFTAGFFACHSVASGGVVALAPAHRSQASALYLVSYYAGSSVIGTAAGLAWTGGGWPVTVATVTALFLGAGVVILLGARPTRTGVRPRPRR